MGNGNGIVAASNKEEKGKGGKAMAKVMRVAGDKECKGSKAIATVTRMVGKWSVMARKRGMVMAMRVAGKRRQWQQRG